MSRTYKVTGINLKGMPLGEADRLLTILTQELGLIRVVAPGARKQNSKLGGRSGLFVVNELLIAKGRSLDGQGVCEGCYRVCVTSNFFNNPAITKNFCNHL